MASLVQNYTLDEAQANMPINSLWRRTGIKGPPGSEKRTPPLLCDLEPGEEMMETSSLDFKLENGGFGTRLIVRLCKSFEQSLIH
ncbi:hypothetical protein N7454_004625 [Penicillium verhagenii]|nr:hypothetical protein N7454_004625 [Penicillium verhagenii]